MKRFMSLLSIICIWQFVGPSYLGHICGLNQCLVWFVKSQLLLSVFIWLLITLENVNNSNGWSTKSMAIQMQPGRLALTIDLLPIQ